MPRHSRAFIAVTGDFSGLRAGERGTILTLANDREQAGIAFGFIRGYFAENATLAELVERELADELHLKNGASILVSTANIRAPRGRTVACGIYDECAFWRSDDAANPDSEIDAAVTPGLMRFPGSLKIFISSVNARKGLLYDRIVEFYGKDSDEVLAILGTSRQEMDKTLDAAVIAREIERDPERAGAEFESRWRDDLSDFLDRELVEAAVIAASWCALRPLHSPTLPWSIPPAAGAMTLRLASLMTRAVLRSSTWCGNGARRLCRASS